MEQFKDWGKTQYGWFSKPLDQLTKKEKLHNLLSLRLWENTIRTISFCRYLRQHKCIRSLRVKGGKTSKFIPKSQHCLLWYQSQTGDNKKENSKPISFIKNDDNLNKSLENGIHQHIKSTSALLPSTFKVIYGQIGSDNNKQKIPGINSL